jgi:hypothetical protein
MFGTSFVPVFIVIIITVKIKKMIIQFQNSGTTSPQSAKTLDELNIRRRHLFQRLVRRGVFIEYSPGRFYLNEDNLDDYNRGKRMRMLIVVVVLIALILVDIYFTR